MNLVGSNYELFKNKKINCDDFVKRLRIIAGDALLRLAILKYLSIFAGDALLEIHCWLSDLAMFKEGGVRGQRPPGVCLDGRPPLVVNECPHWGYGVNLVCALGALSLGFLSGDKDASNIWGEPRLYLRPQTREIAGSGGLSLVRKMPYP
ncbi:hypothetical protein AgCh_038724 [Apium graveolens]